MKVITPLGTNGTAEHFIKMGVALPKEEILRRMGAYLLEAYTYRIPAKQNVPQVLRRLKERGASLNVLTASPHLVLDPCLKRLGLYDLFDNVWSCDDFATTKANPEIYRMAAQRLGKPVDEEDALQMLTALQGRHHTVCTGVTVRQGDHIVTESETTEVYFRPATEAELLAYIATKEPMDKAGSYGVQGKGALLVEKLNGDFFNVMGLPVLRLSRMLAQFGISLLG